MGLPRKKFVRLEGDGAARFLTFSCYRRLPLLQNDRIKDRFVSHLAAAAERRRVAIFAWVVMPEHVHLVVWPESPGDVTAFLTSLKTRVAIDVIKRWRALNAPVLSQLVDAAGQRHFWQLGGGYDRIVVGELGEKIRYCHFNPVHRGLTAACADWRWSSARAYESRTDYVGPLIPFDNIPPIDGPMT